MTVIDPEKWIKRLVTDANGRVDVPLKGIGRYILFADHSVDESRKVAGQAVAQVGYTTTLRPRRPFSSGGGVRCESGPRCWPGRPTCWRPKRSASAR